jgi:hexulose-6-phosphate isomerase
MLDTFPSRDEFSLMEKCAMLKAAGFDAVEPPSGLHREEMIAAAREHSLDIPSVVVSTHWANPLSSPDASVREVGRKGVETALYDAKAYGASVILLVPGVVNEQVSYQEAYDRSRAEIEKLLPLAEELEIVIGIENVWNHFLLSPIEAAAYVDDFRSEWVGWYFDIGNVMNFGWPEQWIDILGDRIVMVHIKEFSRKKRDDEGLWNGFRVHYTEGDNNWEAIMASLRQTGYSGYAVAEPSWRGEDIEPQIFLEQYVSKRMDDIFTHF